MVRVWWLMWMPLVLSAAEEIRGPATVLDILGAAFPTMMIREELGRTIDDSWRMDDALFFPDALAKEPVYMISGSPVDDLDRCAASNVVIGTTSTATELHILGLGTQNNYYANGDATGGALYLQDSGGGQNDGGEILFGSYFGISAMVKGLVLNGAGPAGALIFGTRFLSGNVVERMRVDWTGNVGIGTTSPTFPLSVNGTIQAKEVLVETGWSDYVFAPDYHLQPLKDVAEYINENHHLPGVPSEAEVKQKGVSLGDMQSKLLAKIEELTLHMIQAEERNNRLEERNERLEQQVKSLQERLASVGLLEVRNFSQPGITAAMAPNANLDGLRE